MYIGAYAGYGFTNLLKEAKTEELVMINTADPSNIDYRGTFDSNQTKKANLLRAGLKIAFDFGWPAMKAAKSEPVMAADPELLIRQQNMRDSIAALQAENARLAAEAEQARAAAAAEAARLAAQNDEAARLAREKAAAEKAEAERLAAEKARFDALKAKGQTVAVHFESAGAKLNIQPDEKAVLDDVCQLMANDPSVRIVIYGHTDNTGNAEQNLKYFGLKRAEALRDYMVSQGVPADRITCESKGQTEPVADNATKEGRALNRRANIRFL
jgi:outer membrane protein OmpA-like peptidoglycan-associated protein